MVRREDLIQARHCYGKETERIVRSRVCLGGGEHDAKVWRRRGVRVVVEWSPPM